MPRSRGSGFCSRSGSVTRSRRTELLLIWGVPVLGHDPQAARNADLFTFGRSATRPRRVASVRRNHRCEGRRPRRWSCRSSCASPGKSAFGQAAVSGSVPPAARRPPSCYCTFTVIGADAIPLATTARSASPVSIATGTSYCVDAVPEYATAIVL